MTTRLEPESILPAWVKALALVDEERPTLTELRHAIPACDMRVCDRLRNAALVEAYPSACRQGRAAERLRLTGKGRELLAGCLRYLDSFVRPDDDEDDDTADFPVLVLDRMTTPKEYLS